MNVEEYWNNFLYIHSEYQNRKYIVDSFYSSNGISDKLVNLVIDGKKCATTSCYWTYIDEKNEMPYEGLLTIVIDSKNEPKCIIETIKQKICAFNEITDEDAFVEGEGDKSLEYWQNAHRDFLNGECKKLNREFAESMPVIFEIFRVIYK